VENIVSRGGIKFKNDIDYSFLKRGGPRYGYLGTGNVYSKPLYRYSSETTLKDCALETIKAFEVYLFFDVFGVLRMAPIPGGFQVGRTEPGWDSDVYQTYYQAVDAHSRYGGTVQPYQIILDSLQFTSTLSSSIYNSIQVWTSDRDTGDLIISKASSKDSLLNPDSIGYLGFIREIRIQRPDLGNKAAATNFAQMMKRMYSKPGFEIQFNTVGHITPYRPGEFIKLVAISDPVHGGDLFKRKWRVTSVKHTYSAEKNEWKTGIGCYQIEPGKIVFDPNQNYNQSNPPSGD